MRLGIDFGTTRVTVAAADRGNYPVVSFECPDGAVRDWFPPLVAVRGDEVRYGWDAWGVQAEDGWTVLRSVKRLLGQAGMHTQVEVGPRRLTVAELLEGLGRALKHYLLERSNLRLSGAPQVMLGVPANSNTNQRFLTAEGFRRAGFQVLGILNEPSAASIEFGHFHRLTGTARGPTVVLVYDLGGGTFDASLVEADQQTHTVIASEGLETLGGDDFDEILARLALERAGLEFDTLSLAETFLLLEECRGKKEALHPNTRKIVVDLDTVRAGWGEVTVPVADFYAACRPLVEETIQLVEEMLAAHGFCEDRGRRLDALYVTGGGSELPLVARELRERFERRVKRSAHARSATAIGLAIQADASAGYRLRDRFTRNFGVWREADEGARISFDILFPKGHSLPAPGENPIQICRRYRPAHNIGHFRYLECTRVDETGRPAGDLTLWDEILYPFDPALESCQELEAVPVIRVPEASSQWVEETYACDAGGAVSVTITNLATGHRRVYRLARWAAREAPLRPPSSKASAVRRRGAGSA